MSEQNPDVVLLVIPSLRPDPNLVSTILEAQTAGLLDVVIVDDGSGTAYDHIFAEIAEIHRCVVLKHRLNQGKGAALKTALAYARTRTDVVGIVTADADGQHLVQDMVSVANSLKASVTSSQDRVAILGVRDFSLPDIPRRSRAGNRATTAVVQGLFGQTVRDTQTGLRAISTGLFDEFENVEGQRFEYEMNALMYVLLHRIPMHQVPISTIYESNETHQSHFRPLRDSVTIYANIFRQGFRFSLLSLLGFVVDIVMFALIIDLVFVGSAAFVPVTTTTILARTISALVNYGGNRVLVFDHRSPVGRSLSRYAALALALLLASSLGTTLLSVPLSGHVVWAKIVVDSTLFFASFFVQRHWVFPPAQRGGEGAVAGRV